ncbi:MAG: hypothetical protein ACLFVE_06555 [Chitinispirillaceae bacterium]
MTTGEFVTTIQIKRFNVNKKVLFSILMIPILAVSTLASNLANPATAIPEARISMGASYHLGGYTISNREIPMIMNRIHGRISYSPIKHVNFGVDLGAAQVNVDRYSVGRDTVPVFEGGYGFSGGAHLKLTSPSIMNRFCFIALAQGGMFFSENEPGALYGGKDGAAVLGVQVRIPKFGYVSFGPHLYIINGENRSYEGNESFYSNISNVRGWIAFDYFPKTEHLTKNKPYISVEFTASPKISSTSRVPVQEFSLSISFGAVTPRLYGMEKEADNDF